MSPSVSRLDSLPARPPTPPRDVGKFVAEAIIFLDDSHEIEKALAGKGKENRTNLLDTPQTTPKPQKVISESDGAKKVGFSLSPKYAPLIDRSVPRTSPVYQNSKGAHALKLSKPLKSILKLPTQPIPPTPDELETSLSYFSPEDPGTFTKMLQTVIASLAGNSRTIRLDAYLGINGAFKSYEGIPDVDAIQRTIPRFQQFLERDISWRDDSGKLDVNIIQQALKLTATFLHDQILSEALDSDFKMYLTDRSISVLESSDTPKAIMKHHAYLMGWQRFSTQVMTPGRADKLITALQTIEQRCSGNSVIDSRLTTYQRLLERQPNVMLTRMRDWLRVVFEGMSSTIATIRARAIELCTQAGLKLGDQPSATKAFLDYLETETEKATNFDELMMHLNAQIDSKQNSAIVPQIWAALTLFLRSKRRSIDSWSRVQSWLSLIQRCLNSTDLLVKREADRAWNKFVFTVRPDSSSSVVLLQMLSKPIIVGLQKRKSDKNAKHLQAFALNGYYNLLHYAFRPGLSHAELDFAWDNYIQAIVSDSFNKNGGKGQKAACRILCALFTPKSEAWDELVAFREDDLSPEDLPRIDPKWLRSRFSKVLTTLEPMIASTMWTKEDVREPVDAAWGRLMRVIADAGSQEIRISLEAKEFLAIMMRMIKRLWDDIPVWAKEPWKPTDATSNTWIERFSSLTCTAIDSCGPSQFTEDTLAWSPNAEIGPAPTPSHRLSKHHYSLASPIMCITRLFIARPSMIELSGEYADVYGEILARCINSKPTVPSFQLLSKLLQALIAKADAKNLTTSSDLAPVWAQLALLAQKTLEKKVEEPAQHGSHYVGQAYRDALMILRKGFDLVSTQKFILPQVSQLCSTIMTSVRQNAGDGGLALAAIEPISNDLSRSVPTLSSDALLEISIVLVTSAKWPRDRQTLENAREKLWGVTNSSVKASACFNPYENLCTLIGDTLQHVYHAFQDEWRNSVDEFFVVLLSFLERIPAFGLVTVLSILQTGIASWVKDPSHVVFQEESRALPLADRVKTFWHGVIDILQSLPSTDNALLKSLDVLITAGFTSRRRAIVNTTIEFWNETFGQENCLEYSEDLRTALQILTRQTDLQVPGLIVETNEDTTNAAMPALIESQLDEPSSRSLSAISTRRQVIEGSSLLHRRSPLAKPLSSTPAPGNKSKPIKGSSKTKLRHEDSQIEFAPIEDAPLRSRPDIQMLTEHQQEIRERQHENACIFPDFSSSPASHSTVPRLEVHRKLDFTGDVKIDDAHHSTPLIDAHAGSDYMGSSPTPRAVNKTLVHLDAPAEDKSIDEISSDIPSSPPKRDAEHDNIPELAEAQGDGDVDDLIVVEPFTVDDHPVELQPPEQRNTDTDAKAFEERIDEQLLQQDALNNGPASSDLYVSAANEIAPDDGQPDSSPVRYSSIQASNSQEDIVEEPDVATVDDGSAGSLNLIEESFVQPDRSSNDAVNSPNSQASISSASKKRKRSAGHARSSKKQKNASSFQRFFSSLLRKSQEQEEDDDSLEEEIVVGSGCPDRSPANKYAGAVESSPSKPDRQSAFVVATDKISEAEKPVKRGRGRPRKSMTSSPTPKIIAPAKKLKRKASSLSQGGSQQHTPADGNASSVVAGNSPPSHKARKRREGQDIKMVNAAAQLQGSQGRSTRRIATAVVPTPPKRSLSVHVGRKRHRDEADELDASGGQQADSERERERPIATPKSIFGRLKDVLGDLKNSILGSQEERQMDDLLFEIRRESYEAARRGRELG